PAPVARGAQAVERRVEWNHEVRAPAGEVLGDVERAVLLHLVVRTRVQIERVERRLRRREADEAEEPPLPPRDLEERQRHGLRPDLLLTRHRGRAVEADDHRPASVLLGAAEAVGEELALHQPARELAAEERMAERDELRRQQALEVAPGADLEDLLA